MLPAIISVWFALSVGIAFLGRNFRFGFWGYLFGSILLSPAMGLLLLFAGIPLKNGGQDSKPARKEERGVTSVN